MEMMIMSYSSITISCVVVFLTYWVYRYVNWIWLKPKKLEKCLREQGFKGNRYRLLKGDQEEISMLINEATSKPIKLFDDIKPRTIPHVLHTMEKFGVKSFMWEGRIPKVNITDTEVIKEILGNHNVFRRNVHDHGPAAKLVQRGLGLFEGARWFNRRKILMVSFQAEKLKLMLPKFYSCCHDMVSKWEHKMSKNETIELDVFQDLKGLSGDVLSRTLYGSNYPDCENIFELMKELMSLVVSSMQSVYIPGQWFLPTKKNNRMKQLNKQIHKTMVGIVNKKMEALKGGEVASDFLGILLKHNMNRSKKEGENISIHDIIEECRLFSFAGNDSTADFLSWTLLMLSTNPEWQKRAREEILEVFGDGQPTYNDIHRLKNITMILYEVLRLYPPAVELTKIVGEDIKIGDLFLPAGAHVMLPIVMLHQDPEIWGKDALEFKPERFSEGVSKAAKKPGAYFPFSMGPRICIGQNYALLEAKMALALILPRFSFELSPSYQHGPLALLSMLPQYGLPLVLRKL